MKKITRLSSFLLLLLVLGCNKDRDTRTVEGTVIAFGTNEPIEKAMVILQLGAGATSFGGGASVSRKDTFITEADGNYFFSYKVNDFPYSNLVAKHDEYFFKNPPDGIVGPNYYFDIVMDPYAWVKLHIKNTLPVNSLDNIRYNGSWGGGSPLFYNGMDVDSYVLKQVLGNRDINVYWWITKNNVKTSLSDIVYCPGGDTTLFEIFY